MQETWIWSLEWEDPLEEGMATHSSILRSGGLQSIGSQRIGHNWVTKHTYIPMILLEMERVDLEANFEPMVFISASLFAPEKCIKLKENEAGKLWLKCSSSRDGFLKLEATMCFSVWTCSFVNMWEGERLGAEGREWGRYIEKEKGNRKTFSLKQFIYR